MSRSCTVLTSRHVGIVYRRGAVRSAARAAGLKSRRYRETPARKPERPARQRKQRTRSASLLRRPPSVAGTVETARPHRPPGFPTAVARAARQPPHRRPSRELWRNEQKTCCRKPYSISQPRMRLPLRRGLDGYQVRASLLMTMHAWDNEDYVKTVRATGRETLIVAGRWTSVCVIFSSLDAK